MEPSVENVLVDLILNKQAGISIQLKKQAAELKSIECTEPSLGKWIDDIGITIIEILNSPDEYFNSRFPGLNEFSAADRARLAGEILDHTRVCSHCRLKLEQDAEFEHLVDDVFEQNRDEIKSLFPLTSDEK